MVSLGVQDTGLIHFEKVRDGNGVIWRLRLRRPGRRLRNPWPSPDAAKFACDRSRLSCYLYDLAVTWLNHKPRTAASASCASCFM